jgi:hypothetical protein
MTLVRRSLMVAALAIAVARCADQPTAVQPAGPQFLDWADPDLQFSAIVSDPSVSDPSDPGIGAVYLGPPVNLEQKHVRFWAVRGQSRSVQINYKGSHDEAPHPFLLLTTTDPRFVPGIGELAVGDSVRITVKVDPKKLTVQLEPTGLQFGAPAKLTLWYDGAGDDLNDDGVSDAADSTIEATDLGLFYREDRQDPWTQLAASQSLQEKSFTYDIPHFSFYAVAKLMEWAVQW